MVWWMKMRCMNRKIHAGFHWEWQLANPEMDNPPNPFEPNARCTAHGPLFARLCYESKIRIPQAQYAKVTCSYLNGKLSVAMHIGC